MESKSGFHRIVTVDDGKLWYRIKDSKQESPDVSGQDAPEQETPGQGDLTSVNNLCSSTVEMCAQAVEPGEKFNQETSEYEKKYKDLPMDELNRILNDFRSTEPQRAAAGNLRQKKLGIGPDNGNY